eukprot:g7385.t1
MVCQKGFGEPVKRPGSKKEVSFTKLNKGQNFVAKEGWIELANAAEFKESRPTLPVITDKGIAVVIYKYRDDYFCSDANSTAYQFPLNNAKIFDGPSGPAVECPFDGTTYDLKTGRVLEWCPRTNPIRSVLGMLKSKETPKDLGVYDVVVADDGTLFAKLY